MYGDDGSPGRLQNQATPSKPTQRDDGRRHFWKPQTRRRILPRAISSAANITPDSGFTRAFSSTPQQHPSASVQAGMPPSNKPASTAIDTLASVTSSTRAS